MQDVPPPTMKFEPRKTALEQLRAQADRLHVLLDRLEAEIDEMIETRQTRDSMPCLALVGPQPLDPCSE